MRWVTQRRSSRGGGRLAVVAYCVCAVYLNAVASLALWAVVPVVAHLTPTLIVSGSMAPSINTGDVVLVRPTNSRVLRRGQVVTFDDPANPGRLLTHRVVHANDDGSVKTRGDANPAMDSTPVSSDAIRGIGQLVIPAVGLPAMWVRGGQWLAVLLWLAGTALALRYTWTYSPRLALTMGWSAPLTPVASPPPLRPAPGQWERPQITPRTVRWASAALVLALGAAAVMLPAAMASRASWAALATNPSNDFTAAAAFCTSPGTQTLTAAADAKVEQNTATTNYGATADLVVDPRNNRAIRSLIKFTLPAQPASCTMTATLRVYTNTGVAGRTIEAYRAAAAWAEGTVTWTNAPATAGTATTAASRNTAGWVDITVTSQVAAMYAGTDYGFLLKDSVETTGAGFAQSLSSRTGANPPQLLLNYGSTPGRPPAPSPLTAQTLSASRVALTWTDNGIDETGYTVQRAAAGTGDWTTVASPGAPATTHTDTGLASSTAYDYRVRAVNAQGPSVWSNVATATTQAAPAMPAAPTNLVVNSTGVNSVTLGWTDNATTEDLFSIERTPFGQTAWTLAGTVGPNITTYTDTGRTANTAYTYRVRAQNNGGDSTWSNSVNATTGTCASAPTQTLISTGDAAVAQAAPTTALQTTNPTTLMTRSQNAAAIRSVVRFAAPTVPLGCSVATANLRLNVSTQTAARTVQVYRAGSSWTEATVTWNNQPSQAGTAATATSAVGWVSINVLTHVTTQLAGTNDGFLVKDSVETAATATDVNMSPREGANPPQLVVTFGP